MATNSPTLSGRSIVGGLVIVGVVLIASLAFQYGPTATAAMLWSGLIGVLYIVIPVAVVATLLLGFFRFNAWRESNP